MDTQKLYFELLTNLGKKKDEIFLKYLNKDPIKKYKESIYQPILKSRVGKQKARSLVAFLSYCSLNNKDPREEIDDNISKLISIPEMIIEVLYLTNWIKDNKNEAQNEEKRSKMAISLPSLTADTMMLASEFGTEYIKKSAKAIFDVTKAFEMEDEFNLENKVLMDMKFKDYLKFYLEEYGVPGVGRTYSVGIDLVAMYTNKVEESQKLKEIFLQRYGPWLEVLNDLGDFAIDINTSYKVPKDQFSDIKNKTVKPPLWLMYKNSNKKEKEFIETCMGKKNLNFEEKQKLVLLLFNTNTYSQLKKMMNEQSKIIFNQIKYLNNDFSTQVLKHSAEILNRSKIYVILEQNYQNINSNQLFHQSIQRY